MKRIVRQASIVLALGLLAALPARAQTFQNFVGVGDSLIAGEESGCVVQRFEQRSWMALAADRLGQTNFQQPSIQEIPATSPLTGYPCLGVTLNGTSLGITIVSETGQNANLLLPRPYNNLGFNGSPLIADFVDLTVTHPGPGQSDLDNLAAPILRNCEGCPFQGMSAVDEANLLAPDLVAFWGGNNDVLNAMFAGVSIVGVTITPPDSFATSYNEVITGLSAPGRTVVTYNVPNILDIPYATTIPPVLVDPATRQPVVIGGQMVPLLGPGDDAFPCTPVPPDQGCALPAGSLVMLPASTLLGQGVGIPVAAGGTGQPLPHGTFTPPATLTPGVILYPDDIATIVDTTNAYNASIASAASANGAILIDANALFANATAHGFDIGGIHLTSAYATGGLFSYDGVHPSAIGYAIIADTFIQTLNAVKGTSYPRVNFSDVLFTPNVPPAFGGSVTSDGGPWHYALGTWSAVLHTAFSPRLAVVMPSTPQVAPVVPRGIVPPMPRTVERGPIVKDARARANDFD